MPINEPADGLKKSQIQEFIDYYETGGIQHLALSTRDIISTVEMMQTNGVDFLPTPRSYYENLEDRIGPIEEDIETLEKLGILVDVGIRANVRKVEIERNANQLSITIHTAKPGIVIGRGGQKVDELRAKLEALTGRRVRANIEEIRNPELEARLVAQNVAEQLERRVAFRRAIKQAVQRTMQRGALGCKIIISGRLGGAELSRRASGMAAISGMPVSSVARCGPAPVPPSAPSR